MRHDRRKVIRQGWEMSKRDENLCKWEVIIKASVAVELPQSSCRQTRRNQDDWIPTLAFPVHAKVRYAPVGCRYLTILAGVVAEPSYRLQVLPAAGWTLLKRCQACSGIADLRPHTEHPC